MHDQHRTVDNFSYSLIKGEDHQVVEKPRKTKLKDEDHLTVHQNFNSKIESKWLAKAGEEIHLESLLKAVIEAGVDLTIKVEPSFVRFTPAGVTMVGPTIDLYKTSGEAGIGTAAKPLLPEGSKLVAKGVAPVSERLTNIRMMLLYCLLMISAPVMPKNSPVRL